jgi:GNAT superfamily N-acetyltransferase
MDAVQIRLLSADDVPIIAAAFAAIGWNKPASQYERYLTEQDCGERVVLVAVCEGVFVGYVTVVWCSGYPPFRDAAIPEIADFNVLPRFRRRGIGSRLLDEAERYIAERSPAAGIGVGLFADYGAAQRLYVRRGYLPDGCGLFAHDHHVAEGETVIVDNDLGLNLTKALVL